MWWHESWSRKRRVREMLRMIWERFTESSNVWRHTYLAVEYDAQVGNIVRWFDEFSAYLQANRRTLTFVKRWGGYEKLNFWIVQLKHNYCLSSTVWFQCCKQRVWTEHIRWYHVQKDWRLLLFFEMFNEPYLL